MKQQKTFTPHVGARFTADIEIAAKTPTKPKRFDPAEIDRLDGARIWDAVDMLESEFGAHCWDGGIDDGGDEPGTYVMYRSCTLADGTDVTMYYLDTAGIVEYVEATNNGAAPCPGQASIKQTEV